MEKSSKNFQKIIELKDLSHFSIEWNLGYRYLRKGRNKKKHNTFNRDRPTNDPLNFTNWSGVQRNERKRVKHNIS